MSECVGGGWGGEGLSGEVIPGADQGGRGDHKHKLLFWKAWHREDAKHPEVRGREPIEGQDRRYTKFVMESKLALKGCSLFS